MHPTVVVICPCCASITDATPTPRPQTFTCLSCDQEWTMTVDANRHTEHSLT